MYNYLISAEVTTCYKVCCDITYQTAEKQVLFFRICVLHLICPNLKITLEIFGLKWTVVGGQMVPTNVQDFLADFISNGATGAYFCRGS